MDASFQLPAYFYQYIPWVLGCTGGNNLSELSSTGGHWKHFCISMPRPLICWQWKPAASVCDGSKWGHSSETSRWCCASAKVWVSNILKIHETTPCRSAGSVGIGCLILFFPSYLRSLLQFVMMLLRSTWAAQVWEAGLWLWAGGQRRCDGFFPSLILQSHAEKKRDSPPAQAHTTHNIETDPVVILACRVMILTF